jgi:hypothetical protein
VRFLTKGAMLGRMRFGLKIAALLLLALVAMPAASLFRTGCVEYHAYMKYGEEDEKIRHEELRRWREKQGLDGQLRPVTRPSVIDDP